MTDRPNSLEPATLGQLRASGWVSRAVKDEVRENAIARIRAGEALFPGVLGYEDTVLPQLENALLAGHDVIFLGERGQAKTRMIRSITELLDEWMPIVAGSEINDDPYKPVSKHARDLVGGAGRRHADRVGAPRRPLRREAGHARHLHRRPHRRGRSDQGGRGPLPVRRADAALRPRAAHQPRHLRHQRAARPRRAHPGRPAQRARGTRRADPRLQDPPAARRHAVRLGQPRGLHQPRPHHHAAEGPLRRPDPHALPARGRHRGRHRPAGGAARSRPTASASTCPTTWPRSSPRSATSPARARTSTSARACRCASRCRTSRRWSPTPCGAPSCTARPTSCPGSATSRPWLRPPRARSRSSRSTRAATSRSSSTSCGRHPHRVQDSLSIEDLRAVVDAFDGSRSCTPARTSAQPTTSPGRCDAGPARTGAELDRRRRVRGLGRQRGRVRARGPPPVEAPQQGVGRRSARSTAGAVSRRYSTPITSASATESSPATSW